MTLLPPPPPVDVPAGRAVPAGLDGRATSLPDLDFETYSEAGYVWDDASQRWEGPPGAPKTTRGLPLVGAEPYVRHPSFRIVWMAYDLKDGLGKRRWHPGMPPPADLFAHVQAGGVLEAWNVAFERWVWELHCVPVLGWPAMREDQWFCAMAKARAFALPGQLGKAGDVLSLPIQKDKEGSALMKRLSMPRQPTKGDPRRFVHPIYTEAEVDAHAMARFVHWLAADPGASPRKQAGMMARATAAAREDFIDTWRYGNYNVTDIASEAQASLRIPDLDGEELAWWRAHERINRRGVHIDRQGVENCIAIVEQAFAKYNVELAAITGVDAASKIQQLQDWLRARGVHLDGLDEDNVSAALKNPVLAPDVRRVLEIRAAVGSASIKKLFAIRNRLSADDRLRDLYVYHGARTGRSTGEGPQPTNLPRSGPNMVPCGCGQHYGAHRQDCPFCGAPREGRKPAEWNPTMAEQALEQAGRRSLEWMEHVYGEALATLAGCLRALFCAAPGHDLISTDYSSIEAVGLAMMAGEQWRIDVFRSHGKIYEASAAQAFRVPLEEILNYPGPGKHPLRQKGKGLELGCFAPETLVLTPRGYVEMGALRLEDKVWDGIEWVSHAGVVARGVKRVIDLDGVKTTPEHRVLCGTSWLEASRLASSASTLCRALATGSERLPFSRSSEPAASSRYSSAAIAVARHTSLYSRTFDSAERPAATPAPKNNQPARASSIAGWLTSFPTKLTESVCLAASRLPSADATTLTTRGTPATARVGSTFTPSGDGTSEPSCSTSSRCQDGTTRSSTWTGLTSMARTLREIFGSSHGPRTLATSAGSTSSVNESETWRNVFDVALAGPRNRFTVKTASGHLIVHNCGYQGWLGAAKQFDVPGTDDEIKDAILAWRAASPAIEWFWGGQQVRKALQPIKNALQPSYGGRVDDRLLWLNDLPWESRYDQYLFGVEGMAVLAVLEPGSWHAVTRLDGTDSGVAFQYDAATQRMYCRLPSGRKLTYHNWVLAQSDRGGYAMSYEGWNTNPKNGPVGWIRMETWGGRLVENINQATCRDVLRAGCLILEYAQYPVVLHVYDEIVSEVPKGYGSIEEFETLVTANVLRRLTWAADWPIKAPGGYREHRYRKG